MLVCEGAASTLWAATADGAWRADGTLPVRDTELGSVALASDGTLLVRASWSDPSQRRAFIRAPHAAGDPAAWREIPVGDALDVRVAPNGAALVLRTLEAGHALAVDVDTQGGRSVVAARVPLDAHLVDVSIERGKLALWTLQNMQRGRPAAGSPSARGAAQAFAVLEDGSLEKLPVVE